MAPNAKPIFLDSSTLNESKVNNNAETLLTDLLDKQADTDGLQSVNDDNEDWTDVKHSERKKRDRILDDGVLIGLMKKSDQKGLQRLFTNLTIMAGTIAAIYHLGVDPLKPETFTVTRLAILIPLYFFYGFQFQCFAFAGQHEFLHRNAFKSKWINDLCLFYTGVFCFEFGKHERIMHKQHHTYTNNIDKDPELTSYYSRDVLENEAFRNIPLGRMAYLAMFLDFYSTFKARICRVIFSAAGIPVDYSGTSWSLGDFYYTKESGIMQDLQRTAQIQLLHWAVFVALFGTSLDGLKQMAFWWVVPVMAGYPVVNYFRNLEHADCEVSREPNCLKNTRSVRSNLLIRVLLWDTNFHAEHHLYPMVPFYNLHKLNELMYEHVIHNEHDHFTLQNIAAIKRGGWIDQQMKDMEEFSRKQQQKHAKSE